nr:nuclear transport factor 2 family protein [Novosphingobium sp. 9U]
MTRHEHDALERLLGETLLYGHSNGMLDTKQSFLGLLRSGTLTYIDVSPEVDGASFLDAATIVASGMLKTKARIGDVEKDLVGRYLCIWNNGAAGWQLCGLQGSSLPS